ncbi:hypothetical protein [Lysobacter antibioticus]|uniref:hypothetical protein n=1 Tax=Lysobacter antibioticus TaxID=84531 RepID=UPI001187704D|nr:hypothetical protein [Lysobacter antibioticus]
MDIFELGDLFLSWRLYVGIAVSATLCWLVFASIPSETLAWIIAAPLGVAGIGLSFWWQVRADLGK